MFEVYTINEATMNQQKRGKYRDLNEAKDHADAEVFGKRSFYYAVVLNRVGKTIYSTRSA